MFLKSLLHGQILFLVEIRFLRTLLFFKASFVVVKSIVEICRVFSVAGATAVTSHRYVL